jgi:HlyD family secretion protein
MKRSTGLIAAGVVVLVVAAFAWALAPRPVEVEVAQVSRGRFEASIEEDAKTRLHDRYVVSAPLAGSLARIALREGDAIEADAVVATLTPALSPMLDERTLREQQARLEAAQAQVQRAQVRIEGAKVSLQQAHNEAQRSEQLARQGFVSETKLDNDRLAALAAQKELEAASEDRHVAQHEVEQARAALSVVQRNAGAAGFAVRSPVAGCVLRVVQPSEATVPLGAPLIEIGDVRQMEVVAELLTTDAVQARPGSRVRIERWGGGQPLQGRVRLVEPSAFTKVSALGVEEQRVKVLIDITSPPEQWRVLGDGYRVVVHVVTLERDQAVQVPVSAVFPRTDGPGMAVLRLEAGRARLQPVELGARNGSAAWIKSGLVPGQTVIVYPPSSVSDGSRVRARRV